MMKRKLALLLTALFCCLPLCGCGDTVSQDDDAIHAVCTIFPTYDWAREILGDTDVIELTLLAADGMDLHSYQPSVADIAAIQEADIFCYVGGTSDTWVSDLLDSADLDQMQTIACLEVADAREKVMVEGMQEEDEEEDAEEIDEHVWLSLRQAQVICTAILDVFCTADPENSAVYTANCDAYLEKLQDLDSRYEALVSVDAVRSSILMADRFPFRYLAEDYDLTYYAAFPGCSAETEASFETIAFLAEKAAELELPYILVTESSDQSIASTILESAGSDAGILILDSLQSVTQEQLEGGATYYGRMEENLKTLQKALT